MRLGGLAGSLTLAVLVLLSGASASEPKSGAYQWGGVLGNATQRSSTPIPVLGDVPFATVALAETFLCGLVANGTAQCVSGNATQLGSGSENAVGSATPVPVSGGHAYTALAASQWASLVCAIRADDASLECWGGDNGDPSGTVPASSMAVPPTPAPMAPGLQWAAVAVGIDLACGIEAAPARRVLCFGTNKQAALGRGQTEEQLSNSTEPQPVATPTGLRFTAVGATNYHGCALAETQNVMCWGANESGQGGNGTLQPAEFTAPRLVTGGHKFRQLSVGGNHVCGLVDDGEQPGYAALCWGNNSKGQLGCTGCEAIRESGSPVPLRVEGHRFEQIMAGINYTCGVAVGGGALCWGQGSVGDSVLGRGPLQPLNQASQDTSLPFPVWGNHTFRSLAGGRDTAVGLLAGNSSVAAQVPPPGAAPEAPIEAPPAPSSPVPAGAIAGAAVGAVVVAGLAFFALRPGKGWLCRTAAAAPALEDGSPSGSLKDSPAAGASMLDSQLSASGTPSGTTRDTMAAASLSSQPGRRALGSTAVGMAAGWLSSAPDDDIVLSFISSQLASRPPLAPTSQPALLAPGNTSGNGGNVAAELRTHLRLWEVQWEALAILRLLGRGSFGSVYLGEWQRTLVAVKVLISKDKIDRGEMELPQQVMRDLQTETAVMSRMRHPNIVQFMGLVTMPPALITEYCSRGSLFDCLAAALQHPEAAAQLTWRRRLCMAIDAATGLLYLHGRSIIHRDVKSPNLLVDEHWSIKVADFNLSRILGAQAESGLSSADVTNPIWLAPEVLRGKKASTASDVYSFGMVLFELLTWRLPWTFAELSPFKVGAIIRQGGRPEVPTREQLPGPDTASWGGLDGFVQLMRECWAQAAGERPSFDEVVGRLQGLLESTPAS